MWIAAHAGRGARLATRVVRWAWRREGWAAALAHKRMPAYFDT